MTRPYRFLSTIVHSSSTVVAESPREAVQSDFIFILAGLLCALVCVVGLIAIAHCTWLRRRSLANQIPAQPSATNKGIEKKLVEMIPKFPYDSAKEEKGGDCVICLVEYADGDEIRVLPQCRHGFHVGCIDKWLGSRSSCRQIAVVGKCKTCDDEGRPHNGGSSSVNKVVVNVRLCNLVEALVF